MFVSEIDLQTEFKYLNSYRFSCHLVKFKTASFFIEAEAQASTEKWQLLLQLLLLLLLLLNPGAACCRSSGLHPESRCPWCCFRVPVKC